MLNDTTKTDVYSRLKKIEGQVRGLEKMVDEKRYCMDILNQVAAVRSALDSVSMVMLKRHMETCVSSAIRDGRSKAVIDEIIDSVGRFVR